MDNTTHLPYVIEDVADRLDGASRDDLSTALSAAVDRVYFLRSQAAWAATQLERALEYKGFSAYRRPFGEAQVQFLTRAAKGEAEAVKFDRRSERVERVGQLHSVPTWLRSISPDIDTDGPVGEHRDLAVGVAWALQEVLALRQLLAYEAGVARVHDIPSGPKGVRAILETVDRILIESIDADPNALTGELRSIDRKVALRAVGAKTTLTNSAFLAEHSS